MPLQLRFALNRGKLRWKEETMQAFLSLFFWLFALPETICLLKGFKGKMQNSDDCEKIALNYSRKWRKIGEILGSGFIARDIFWRRAGGKQREVFFQTRKGLLAEWGKRKVGKAKQRRVNGLENGGEVFLPFPSLILSFGSCGLNRFRFTKNYL